MRRQQTPAVFSETCKKTEVAVKTTTSQRYNISLIFTNAAARNKASG